MRDDTAELYEVAEGPRVQDYVQELDEASAHVQECDEGSFLYVQTKNDGCPERVVLAYQRDGELYSPENISDDPEFREELDNWLLGHGEVVLDESVLEKRPTFV